MSKVIDIVCDTIVNIGSPEDFYTKQDSLLFIDKLKQKTKHIIKYVSYFKDNNKIPSLTFDLHVKYKGYNEIYRFTIISLNNEIIIGFTDLTIEYTN